MSTKEDQKEVKGAADETGTTPPSNVDPNQPDPTQEENINTPPAEEAKEIGSEEPSVEAAAQPTMVASEAPAPESKFTTEAKPVNLDVPVIQFEAEEVQKLHRVVPDTNHFAMPVRTPEGGFHFDQFQRTVPDGKGGEIRKFSAARISHVECLTHTQPTDDWNKSIEDDYVSSQMTVYGWEIATTQEGNQLVIHKDAQGDPLLLNNGEVVALYKVNLQLQMGQGCLRIKAQDKGGCILETFQVTDRNGVKRDATYSQRQWRPDYSRMQGLASAMETLRLLRDKDPDDPRNEKFLPGINFVRSIRSQEGAGDSAEQQTIKIGRGEGAVSTEKLAELFG